MAAGSCSNSTQSVTCSHGIARAGQAARDARPCRVRGQEACTGSEVKGVPTGRVGEVKRCIAYLNQRGAVSGPGAVGVVCWPPPSLSAAAAAATSLQPAGSGWLAAGMQQLSPCVAVHGC